jgi:uncharacterized membrane protein YcaP (DUF421 family)
MDALHTLAQTLLGLSDRPQQLNYLQIGLRAVIVYLAMILFVRFGKKRFLARATAFDAVLVIVIGSTAARAITGNAPFFEMLFGVLILIGMHWLLSLLSRDSPTVSALVKGHSSVLVENGRMNPNALKKEHMSKDDLEEDLRQEGVDTVAGVKEARLERSGHVSVIKK